MLTHQSHGVFFSLEGTNVNIQNDKLRNNNSPTDFYVPSEEKINKLKFILETDLNQEISYKDAEEISVQLIALYECLARDKRLSRITHESAS